MKKILLLVSFLCTLLFAGTVMASYPDYLGGNRNLLLCGGHMGIGWYVDKTSLVVQEYNPPVYQIAVNVLSVPNADRGNTSFDTHTVYWRYHWDTRKMYRLDENGTWQYVPPVGSMAQTGHEFSGEMAFYLAYHMKFYGGRKFWDNYHGSWESPNFSDDLYRIVDNA